jgi:nitroreductase
MEVGAAIRSRRSHKRYSTAPVPREIVEDLLEQARWAPNHHLTQPWRFRVLGPESLARLAATGGPGELEKLSRAPTLVVASAKLTGDDHQNHEDVLATACAVYIVLLAAHARGLATYWRTPAVLRSPEGRAAVSVADGEHVLGLLHLGTPRQTKEPPEREPVEAVVSWLE